MNVEQKYTYIISWILIHVKVVVCIWESRNNNNNSEWIWTEIVIWNYKDKEHAVFVLHFIKKKHLKS